MWTVNAASASIPVNMSHQIDTDRDELMNQSSSTFDISREYAHMNKRMTNNTQCDIRYSFYCRSTKHIGGDILSTQSTPFVYLTRCDLDVFHLQADLE